MDPLKNVNTRATSRREKVDPRQVSNSAGGQTFTVGRDAQVHRFLTLGTTGGTYYTSERELTKQTAAVVLEAARENATALVEQIMSVSLTGRAPRQNPALFALAAAAGLGDQEGRRAALLALPLVARTGTHLLTFAGYAEQFRGWGRGLRRGVARWYEDKTPADLAYQVVKCRQRGGWSHRDLLRLSHPEALTDKRATIFDWISGRHPEADTLPELIQGFERAQHATGTDEWVKLVERYPLTWEMLPDAARRVPKVWEALLARGMPQTALLRNLSRLTELGVIGSGKRAPTARVAAQLTDQRRLVKAHVHPVNVLVAARTYASGRSVRGKSTWTPSRTIMDALDGAFYASFGAVEATGRRTLYALDVSGSMSSAVAGYPITCREMAGALALVTLATETDATVIGFTGPPGPIRYFSSRTRQDPSNVSELDITPRRRLDDVVRYMNGLPFGTTDCALPMLWAQSNDRVFDTIVIVTDNETWSGGIYPHQALARYRQHTGVPTRLVVVALTPTAFTIADPADPGSLDVSGFDSAVPNLLADFSRGAL